MKIGADMLSLMDDYEDAATTIRNGLSSYADDLEDRQPGCPFTHKLATMGQEEQSATELYKFSKTCLACVCTDLGNSTDDDGGDSGACFDGAATVELQDVKNKFLQTIVFQRNVYDFCAIQVTFWFKISHLY